MDITCRVCPDLTGAQAVHLAEEAMKAGRLDLAACYLDVAFAIFDATMTRSLEPMPQPHAP